MGFRVSKNTPADTFSIRKTGGGGPQQLGRSGCRRTYVPQEPLPTSPLV